jgi:hypothetical protein
MPAITATSMRGVGVRVLTETTLNGTDSFTYEPGDVLILRNPTGGAITPTIDGADGTTWPVPGAPALTVSSGLSLGEIAAGAARVVPLDTVRAYCQGAVAVTSGSGLVAAILRV